MKTESLVNYLERLVTYYCKR